MVHKPTTSRHVNCKTSSFKQQQENDYMKYYFTISFYFYQNKHV